MFYLEAELTKPPRIPFAQLTWLDNFNRLEMELSDLLKKDQIWHLAPSQNLDLCPLANLKGVAVGRCAFLETSFHVVN